MTQLLTIKSNQPPKTVNLTDKAVDKVRELIAAEGDADLALRVAVRPGGCSGFSYEMFFDAEIDDTDIVEEYGDVRVVIDPQSAEMVGGSTLDYKDSLMGLVSPSTIRTPHAPAGVATPSPKPAERVCEGSFYFLGTLTVGPQQGANLCLSQSPPPHPHPVRWVPIHLLRRPTAWSFCPEWSVSTLQPATGRLTM